MKSSTRVRKPFEFLLQDVAERKKISVITKSRLNQTHNILFQLLGRFQEVRIAGGNCPTVSFLCVDVHLLALALKQQKVQLETSQTAFYCIFFNKLIFLQLTWWLANHLGRAHHLLQRKHKCIISISKCAKSCFFYNYVFLWKNKTR